MLYTNKTLEIAKIKGEKVVELVNMYGTTHTYKTEPNFNEKIFFIGEDVVHRFLTLNEDLEVQNKADNDLYLVLDLLDYKSFRKNSSISLICADDNVNVSYVNSIEMKNRFKTNWTIETIKIEGSGLVVFELKYTSTRTEYIVVEGRNVSKLSYRQYQNWLEQNPINKMPK